MDPYHRDIMKFLLAEIERLALECRAREVIMSHMKVLGEAVAVYERAMEREPANDSDRASESSEASQDKA